MLLSPIHCCDVTKPYLLSGELCTSPLHSNCLHVYIVCCRRGGQCFPVVRTRHTDVVGDSSGRSYVTEQGHNVPLLRTRALHHKTLHSTQSTSLASSLVLFQVFAENAPLPVKSFFCHWYVQLYSLTAVQVATDIAPQVFEAVHLSDGFIFNVHVLTKH